MRPCADIRAEGNIVDQLHAVVLQEFQHVAPAAVECDLDRRLDQQHDLLTAFGVVPECGGVVLVCTRSVGAVFYAGTAADALVGVDVVDGPSVLGLHRLVSLRSRTGADAGIAGNAFIRVEQDHK